MNWRVLVGDVRERLRDLDAGSVQTCVTSPPYWGLRDYGYDGQIGLEPTPSEYVASLVAVFADVWRVLRDDGTCWLNLGDSYNSGAQFNHHTSGLGDADRYCEGERGKWSGHRAMIAGLKPKDLVGIPWLVAFALRDAGWYLRSEVIWHKPNPMPESVTDRPTKSHEQIFLLSKSPRYYYDAEAIKEEGSIAAGTKGAKGSAERFVAPGVNSRPPEYKVYDGTRNKRSVWTVATQSFPDAHFATYPEALIEPCILAGSRGEGKRCDCDEVIETPLGSGPTFDPTRTTGRAGMNRTRRPDEGVRPITRREQRDHAQQMRVSAHRSDMEQEAGTSAFAHYIRTDASGARPIPPTLLASWLERGWLVTPAPCMHGSAPADVVLDPFTGSGTTGKVAVSLGRSFVGVELNPTYAEMARRRIGSAAPLFATEVSA